MPYYEYICESCGAETTLTRKIADRDDRVMCQHGEADHPLTHPMKRKVSVVSFALSGGGWYADGYAKKPPGH